VSIEAVIFDYGGVIGRGGQDDARVCDRRYGLPEGSIWRAFYRTGEWEELKVGRGSFDSWRKKTLATLEAAAGRPLPEAWEGWLDYQRGIRQEMLELIRRLRDKYKVGLLSNATTNLEDILEHRHGILGLFDTIVNSARVGMAKPDPRIFALAAERLAVAPAQCVFTDDLEPNVKAAGEVGMHALRFQSYDRLVEDLRGLGVAW
jgi:putative hydrolase of the HAD superfamily